MSLKTWASREAPRASKIWGLLAQWARWNSNIFRTLSHVMWQLLPPLWSYFAKKKTNIFLLTWIMSCFNLKSCQSMQKPHNPTLHCWIYTCLYPDQIPSSPWNLQFLFNILLFSKFWLFYPPFLLEFPTTPLGWVWLFFWIFW